jgi:chromosome partitioning protein
MHILCVFNSKGGVGKSTTCIHVGTAAAATMRVGILDLDTDEGAETVTVWSRARGTDVPPRVKPSSVMRLAADIEEMRLAGADLLILDCPPANTAASASFVEVADFVVIPVKPAMPDMAACYKATRIVKAAGKPFAYLLNCCLPASIETQEAIEALQGAGEICPTLIGDRIAFSRALKSGNAVTEIAQSGKAFDEATAACEWILARIGAAHGN